MASLLCRFFPANSFQSTHTTCHMDDTTMSEARSVEKRPLENGDLGFRKKKKVKKLGDDVKKVAEIVLVLAAMAKMRGGRKPSDVEIEMMSEARAKLVEVCGSYKPKDIFPREGFGSVIEDLGLNRLGGEQKLGIRTPKLSIAEKLLVTKQKMEKAEVFPLHANNYAPPRLQSNLSGAAENRGTSNSVRIFPSDKANHGPVGSGSFQHPSNAGSAANSRALPYQLPPSEVRPMGSNPVSRAERAHFRVDGGANGSPYPSQSQANSAVDHMTGRTSTRSTQPQSASFAKVGSDKVPARSSVKGEGLSDLTTARGVSQGIPSKPPYSMNVNQQSMQYQGSSAADIHSQVSKIVQKILHPHLVNHPTWTPPSRDYMSKALPCQMCKVTFNEVDTALVCDACERGYHLRCLQCNPKAIPKGEWQEWHCPKCLTMSNGKPLPPKYGRVMRNLPKLSSSSVAAQPSLDKNVQSSDVNVNEQMMTTSDNSISQSASGGIAGNDSKLTEMAINKNQERGTESQPAANLSSHLVENHHGDNHTIRRSITNDLAKQSQNNNLLSYAPEISSNGAIEDEQGDHVKISETSTMVSEPEDLSSSPIHEVEWVGDVLQEIDGKTYYQSCCINGTIYKVKDYALFSSLGNKQLPNKLQAMWEDGKTTKKWVTVTRCFFPGDLPEGVGRPCAPESNEVYESNHESTLAAGLIHAPCEVLPPSKFADEKGVQTRLRARGSDRSKPLFLCKWFYDETKRLFRDVTC